MDAVLLDTDILSEVIKLRDPVVQRKALSYLQEHGSLAFSSMTRYEIIRGYRAQNASAQHARFLDFCKHSLVLPVTDAVFERAAEFWAIGRLGGHPHNDADLIIAATAIEHNRCLVTGNTTHFAWIPGLRLDDWRKP